MTDMLLLTEAQMARISPFFLLSHGVPRVDDTRYDRFFAHTFMSARIETMRRVRAGLLLPM